MTTRAAPVRFADDLAFLRAHVETLVLRDPSGAAQVALVPAWQGRVATSTAQGAHGASFGWIHRDLIASRELRPHINVFGGEDRFWIGPEGGQYSIFFPKGAPFDLEHWQTPAPIDSEPFELVHHEPSHALFTRAFRLANWSGASFDVGVAREIALLAPPALPSGLAAVAFESRNTLTNRGALPWTRATGLLSIWSIGMFRATPSTTVVLPMNSGASINDVYFGKVPADRLRVRETVAFFRGDAAHRSKIGIAPAHAKPVLGSWDAENQVLTIVRFTFDPHAQGYVNSLWHLQSDPYAGDVINSYNDGPPTPGAPQLGRFYELESSSPALALAPGESSTHVHSTMHVVGDLDSLERLAQTVLGASLAEIESAFAS